VPSSLQPVPMLDGLLTDLIAIGTIKEEGPLRWPSFFAHFE